MGFMQSDALILPLIAASICAMGCYLLIFENLRPIKRSTRSLDSLNPAFARGTVNSSRVVILQTVKKVFLLLTTITSTFFITFLITDAISISLAFATLASTIPYLINKQRSESKKRNSEMAWPETIDSLVSALQSGLGISDAVLGLADHAPMILRPNFLRIKIGVIRGETLESLFSKEKQLLNSAIADQVFETLILAKQFGGKDSNNALRLLSEFIRDDLEVMEEIRAKFGWIRNSAALATAAPWILLLLLSSQSSTVKAFSSASGVSVLIAGILMTALAYIWMEKVGQLPNPARALR